MTQSKEWEGEFDKVWETLDHYKIKQFISSNFIPKSEIEKRLQIHNHNSILSYTDDLDEGCIECIKNNLLNSLLNKK